MVHIIRSIVMVLIMQFSFISYGEEVMPTDTGDIKKYESRLNEAKKIKIQKKSEPKEKHNTHKKPAAKKETSKQKIKKNERRLKRQEERRSGRKRDRRDERREENRPPELEQKIENKLPEEG